MKYVKLINNTIEYAPKNKGSILNYNLNVEMMLADGYKPFVEVERPVTIRFYHIEYTETDTIAEVVVYDETQAAAEERIRQEEQQEFNRKFFNTSLGYVSRDVHMLNGDVKDFLTDILPLLQEGVEIYTYTANKEQRKVAVTEQFIGECKQQVLVDFYGE